MFFLFIICTWGSNVYVSSFFHRSARPWNVLCGECGFNSRFVRNPLAWATFQIASRYPLCLFLLFYQPVSQCLSSPVWCKYQYKIFLYIKQLWNILNECYSLNILFIQSEGAAASWPSFNFVFEFLRNRSIFRLQLRCFGSNRRKTLIMIDSIFPFFL